MEYDCTNCGREKLGHEHPICRQCLRNTEGRPEVKGRWIPVKPPVDSEMVELKEENKRLQAVVDKLTAALSPSGETKAAYMGEFSFTREACTEDGDEFTDYIDVPWTTTKEIMKAIREYAAQEPTKHSIAMEIISESDRKESSNG